MKNSRFFHSTLQRVPARRFFSSIAVAVLVAALAAIFSTRPVKAQSSCRVSSNIGVQKVIDLFQSTVKNLGNNQFQINFVFASPSAGGVTTICNGTPSCDSSLDGFTPRQDLTGNITAMSNFGSCNTTAIITTSPGVTWVLWAYTVNFEQNGTPSTETFQAGMSTDPNVLPVGHTTSLANMLL